MRAYKKQYYKELHIAGDPDSVKSLPHAKRGRPLALGNLDDKVLDYIRKLRSFGCPVNRTIVLGAAKGIVQAHDKTLLIEYGGHLELGRKWVESFLSRNNFVRRKATKKARQLPNDFASVKEEFISRIQRTCQDNSITDPALVVNIDQTGLKLIPTSDWTLNESGTY